MDSYRPVLDLQRISCHALARLAENHTANQDLIAETNGIRAIVYAMDSISNCGVQAVGCEALSHLAENKRNLSKIASAGRIEALVAAMRQHSTSRAVKCQQDRLHRALPLGGTQ
jgi:hypothetical protein